MSTPITLDRSAPLAPPRPVERRFSWKKFNFIVVEDRRGISGWVGDGQFSAPLTLEDGKLTATLLDLFGAPTVTIDPKTLTTTMVARGREQTFTPTPDLVETTAARPSRQLTAKEADGLAAAEHLLAAAEAEFGDTSPQQMRLRAAANAALEAAEADPSKLSAARTAVDAYVASHANRSIAGNFDGVWRRVTERAAGRPLPAVRASTVCFADAPLEFVSAAAPHVRGMTVYDAAGAIHQANQSLRARGLPAATVFVNGKPAWPSANGGIRFSPV